MSYLSSAYDLKIRDVDQLLDKVYSCLRTISHIGSSKNEVQHINIAALIVGLIEQDFNMASYHKRKDYAPYITDPINDIDLSNDMKVSLYIKLCTESVILRENHIDGMRGPIIHRAPPIREYYMEIRNQGASALKSTLLHSLSSLSDHYDEPNRKYWLWPDMQRIIELAGTFE